jgi:ABC-type uncharacterized transport system substrate-binding protein
LEHLAQRIENVQVGLLGAVRREIAGTFNALVTESSPGDLDLVADLAAKKRLPSAGIKAFAEAGGLIGYGLNFPKMSRRAAYFVDRILKGVKPADLAIQQPTKFELVINLKTAKALGLTLPQSVLLRVDQVIE